MSTRLSAEERYEQEMLALIDQRDAAQEWADKLAYAIAPQSVIGEHSYMNNPWANALEAADDSAAESVRLRAELEEVKQDRSEVYREAASAMNEHNERALALGIAERESERLREALRGLVDAVESGVTLRYGPPLAAARALLESETP